jgi:hypothetical protein
LIKWLEEATQKNGGKASIPEACKIVWELHEKDLRTMGDLFYTWQYDIRWASQYLRESGVLGVEKDGHASIWVIR